MGKAALLAVAAMGMLGQGIASASNAVEGFGQALGRANREGTPGDRRRRREAFLNAKIAYEASRHRGYPGAKLARKALKGKVGKTVLR